MKVKMFVCNNPAEAEKSLNEWLLLNSVHIRHITQSQSEKGGKFVFVISLFYEKAKVDAMVQSINRNNDDPKMEVI